ncbi:hypothetical protein H4R19_000102 [Coemansia spiralis]|nr:hypothetical protein H4R19_000102 [Coemansia spiralis]
MKPDPYKQKASRKYQAAHGIAPTASQRPAAPAAPAAPVAAPAVPAAADSKRYARRRIQDNSWRFHDGAPDAVGTVPEEGEEREEEANIQEFLRYLKDESQSTAAEHSAAYFQLRTEATSAGLDAPNEDTWGRLVEVDWSGLLDMATAMPLHELLGLDRDCDMAPPPPSAPSDPAPPLPRDTPQPRAPPAARTLDVAELAPGIEARSQAAVPARPKQPPAQSVDAMEAFLDDLL